MTEYKFTQDWFHWAPEVWTQLIPHLPERKAFLEIGSFEGRSTVWIVEHMLEDGGVLDCVDTWGGGEEHSNSEMDGAEERFAHNIAILEGKYPDRSVCASKTTSTVRLAEYLSDSAEDATRLDFIYIDGSHIARDVLTDACMAWPLLKPKGIMVFDDYLWGNPRDVLHRPKLAIDAFTNVFAEEVNIVHSGYQLVVQKKG